jgi:hypothetical protein
MYIVVNFPKAKCNDSVDPDVANLRLDLDKAMEENIQKEQKIEELHAHLVSLQRIIEGERSKNCEAEERTKRMEVCLCLGDVCLSVCLSVGWSVSRSLGGLPLSSVVMFMMLGD